MMLYTTFIGLEVPFNKVSVIGLAVWPTAAGLTIPATTALSHTKLVEAADPVIR